MFSFLGRPRGVAAMASASAIAIVASLSPASAQEQQRSYNIPAQSLSSALLEFSRQSDVRVMADPSVVNGRQAPALQGTFTVRIGLDRLLAGSGLTYSSTPSGAILVQDPNSPTRVGDAGGAATSDNDDGYAEILVTGRRTLNADIRRTEDDAQPYVVIGAEEIARSGVSTVGDLLRSRLPMNTQSVSSNSFTSAGGVLPSDANTGLVNLRGLGVGQTLILVDGRRIPNVGLADPRGSTQPQLDGIPPAAIERIEILPATAGGIYGGNATGGVINIILKRDYSGLDLQATYGNTFDTEVSRLDLGLSGGFSLESGRTQVLFTATHREQGQLNFEDRDIVRRSYERRLANNPAAVLPPQPPLFAYPPNFCSIPTPAASACTGPNLVLDPIYGGSALGSNFGSIPTGYAGASSDSGAGLIANAGTYNFDYTPNQPLLVGPESDSLTLNVRRQFGSHLEAYLDVGGERSLLQTNSSNSSAAAGVIRLAADSPSNPFQQNVLVRLPFPNIVNTYRSEVETVHARGGVIIHLPNDWTASVEHNWSRTASSQFGTEFQLATVRAFASTLAPSGVDLFRDPVAFPFNLSALGVPAHPNFDVETALSDTILRASGPIFRLPAGAITLSGYAEGREERVDDAFLQNGSLSASGSYLWYPPKSQEVHSYYLESHIPLFSSAYGSPLAHDMNLMIALRRDEYETRSIGAGFPAEFVLPSRDGPFPSFTYGTNSVDADTYTVALQYAPTPDISFRASLGTGFLPPNLAQITPNPVVTSSGLGINDPRRGGQQLSATAGYPMPITFLFGGSTTLQPEESESIAYGFIFTPRLLEGLRISVDYVQIDKTNEIYELGAEYYLNNEALYPDRVTRGPNVPGDLPGWAGPITTLDSTSVNIAATSIEAYDFQLDYDFDTERFGHWRPYLIATHQTRRQNQVLPTDVPVDTVGFSGTGVGGPLEWRGNIGLDWYADSWSAGWNAQYFDSYNVCSAFNVGTATCATLVLEQGSDSIPRQIYHDLYLGYDFGESSTLLANTSVLFSVQNVLDEEPPIVVSQGAFSSYGDPRLRRFTLTLRKHFGG